MENLKIRVTTEQESQEAQELFFELGYNWKDSGKNIQGFWSKYCFYYTSNGFLLKSDSYNVFKSHNAKEITLPALRDMVVLKRNDVGDATHENAMYPYIKLSDGWYYFDDDVEKWMKSTGGKPEYYEKLKPIEKEVKMKEYLDKDYVLRSVKQTTGDNRVPDGWIEVPEGAVTATLCNDYLIFWNKDGLGFSERDGYIGFVSSDDDMLFKEYMEAYDDISIVWQRSETENTKQPTGIEATLAERQATYGCFEDVAFVTENIMATLAKVCVNGLNELPYPHRMALYMIASKMARIVNGDFNHKDSWHDIGGYAKLVEDLL